LTIFDEPTMTESASVLSAWESFYVVVGSSAGALIGLQFVVITLIAQKPNFATAGGLSAFGTPTVVHFAGALFLSATMSAPWPSLGALSVLLGVCGISGVVYGAIVIRRARSQTDYEPVWEDWLWYAALPCSCHALLAGSAVALRTGSRAALFVIAGVALGLLAIGIHNAWDAITHIVLTGDRRDRAE
jgi:hypothetical protein